MNKARMTIRFDHDPPKPNHRNGSGMQEEPGTNEPGISNRNTPSDWDFERLGMDDDGAPGSWNSNGFIDHSASSADPKPEHLRVVHPEAETDQPDAQDDRRRRSSRDSSRRGRLAEERRRLQAANEQFAGHAHSEHPDPYQDLPEVWDGRAIDSHSRTGNFSVVPPQQDPWESGQQDGGFYEGTQGDDYSYYRTKRTTSFWKMAAAVSAAVITGLMFGYMVLTMFNGGGGGSNNGDISTPGTGSKTVIENEAGTGTGESTGAPAPSGQQPASAVEIPGSTFYMLQYGVFSTPERVEQAKSELLAAGIAAGGDPNEENRVYAGISPDREQAKLLSNQLKAEGVELYVREISLPQAEPRVYSGEAKTLTDYFTVSGQLVSELSALSASLLGQQEGGGPAAAEAMKSVTNLHQQWIQSVKQLSEGLGPESLAVLPMMEQSMNGSVMALSEYIKNQSKGHLWEIQTGMMNYIMGQKKLLDGL
ncbi:SPOR domain-containing protein [Paenibacillus lactis]|uniref:SPOR domain-containing protein n=1 Tax=Paenibacillus lactis TaxID=228574 RepID=UPI00119F04C7